MNATLRVNIRKALYGIMVVLAIVAVFSGEVLPSVQAQGVTQPLREDDIQYKPLISNGLFLYASTIIDFDTQKFLDQSDGLLQDYSEEIDGKIWTAADIISFNSVYFGVNPQFILGLLEAQGNLITQSNSQIPLRANPSNNIEPPKFYYHVKWLAESAASAFYMRRDIQDDGTIAFNNHNIIKVPLDLNAGTYAVQVSLAKILDYEKWLLWATGTEPLFVTNFKNWFGDPLRDPDAQDVTTLALPDGYNLPFPVGNTWYYTGGPHTYNSSGSRPWSSIDLAPPEVTSCSPGSTAYNAGRWIVAAKGGTVIASQTALVVIDHGDGWRTYYSHVSSIERRGTGGVNQNDNLGHPSCEVEPGGSTSGIHVHFAIYKVGTGFVDIAGSSLSGWLIGETSHYNGTMTRQGVVRTATVSRYNGTNDIYNSGSGGSCGITSIPSGYNQCAEEDGFCSFSGTANVIYGANSCYTSPRSFSNGTACNNNVFGDPLPGVRKYCYTNGTSGGSWAYQLFDLGDYNGDKYESNQTITNLSTVGWNDRAESIKINSGYEIIACEHADFQGNCGRVTGPAQFSDINALAQGLRNGLSSIKVCAGSCPNPPAAPSLISPSNGQYFNEGESITLSWTATGSEYYGEIWGGPGSTLTFGWQSGSSQNIGSQWAGYTYSWHVKAKNNVGESGWSSTWNFTIRPGAPTNLNAFAASCSQINLSWNDNSGNEEGYEIYRNGNLIATLGSGVTSYQNTGLSGNTTYSYSVKAYRGSIESNASNTVTVTTPSCQIPPPTPTNFRVASTTTNSITLAWNDVSGETGYKIYKWGYDGSQWTFLYYASVSANVTTYTDNNLPCGNDFNFYELSAYNTYGESDHHPWIQGITNACPPPANDDFSTPKVISQIPYVDTLLTTYATTASDDPPFTACNRQPGLATVWYRYVPTSSGVVQIDTFGSDYDTLLGVWTGSRGSLTLIGCNDDSDGTYQSKVTVSLTTGTTYYIEVAEYNGNLSMAQQSTKEPLSAQENELPLGASSISAQSVGGTLKLSVLRQTFNDVPTNHWAYQFIERLFYSGITTGCGTDIYCPGQTVTRDQMAVFLLRGIHGATYTPPAVGSSTGFTDVPTSYWAAAWIKQLAGESITTGCGGGNYCPSNPVTRDQMAVFLLRAKYGAAYTPPAVGSSTGFTDVPTSYWAAAWIKQLAAEGITSGCGSSNYCPSTPVSRDQMAVFLVRTFNLP